MFETNTCVYEWLWMYSTAYTICICGLVPPKTWTNLTRPSKRGTTFTKPINSNIATFMSNPNLAFLTEALLQPIIFSSKKYALKNCPSWWFQPLWKICQKMGSSSPIFGMKINKALKPPPPGMSNFLCVYCFAGLFVGFSELWAAPVWGTVSVPQQEVVERRV